MSQDSFSNFTTLDLSLLLFLQSDKKYSSKIPEIFLFGSSPPILFKFPLLCLYRICPTQTGFYFQRFLPGAGLCHRKLAWFVPFENFLGPNPWTDPASSTS